MFDNEKKDFNNGISKIEEETFNNLEVEVENFINKVDEESNILNENLNEIIEDSEINEYEKNEVQKLIKETKSVKLIFKKNVAELLNKAGKFIKLGLGLSMLLGPMNAYAKNENIENSEFNNRLKKNNELVIDDQENNLNLESVNKDFIYQEYFEKIEERKYFSSFFDSEEIYKRSPLTWLSAVEQPNDYQQESILNLKNEVLNKTLKEEFSSVTNCLQFINFNISSDFLKTKPTIFLKNAFPEKENDTPKGYWDCDSRSIMIFSIMKEAGFDNIQLVTLKGHAILKYEENGEYVLFESTLNMPRKISDDDIGLNQIDSFDKFMSFIISNKAANLGEESEGNFILGSKGDKIKEKEAIRLLKQAISLDPSNITANYNLRYFLKNKKGFNDSKIAKILEENINRSEELTINKEIKKDESEDVVIKDVALKTLKAKKSKINIRDTGLNKIKFLDDFEKNHQEYSKEIEKEFINIMKYLINNDVINQIDIPGYWKIVTGNLGKYKIEFNDKNRDKNINQRFERTDIEYTDEYGSKYNIGTSVNSGFYGYAVNKDTIPKGFTIVDKDYMMDKYSAIILDQDQIAFRELTEEEIENIMNDVQFELDKNKEEIELNLKNKNDFTKILKNLEEVKDNFKKSNSNYEFIIENDYQHKNKIKGLKYIDQDGNIVVIQNGYVGFNVISYSYHQKNGFFKDSYNGLYINHGVEISKEEKEGVGNDSNIYVKKITPLEVKEIINRLKRDFGLDNIK